MVPIGHQSTPGFVDAGDRLVVAVPAPSLFDGQVVRLKPDGDLDPTFAGDGRRFIPGGFFGQLPVSDAGSGKVYVANAINNSDAVGYVLRVNSDGADDPSFSGDGFLAIGDELPPTQAPMGASAFQRDGAIVFVRTSGRGTSAITVHRLTPSGLSDASFGSAGTTQIDRKEDAEQRRQPRDRRTGSHLRLARPRVRALGRDPPPTWRRPGRLLCWRRDRRAPELEGSFTVWFDLAVTTSGGVRAGGTSLVVRDPNTGVCCYEQVVGVAALRA